MSRRDDFLRVAQVWVLKNPGIGPNKAMTIMIAAQEFPDEAFPAPTPAALKGFCYWLIGETPEAPAWVQEHLENLRAPKAPGGLLKVRPRPCSALWWRNAEALYELGDLPDRAWKLWKAVNPWRARLKPQGAPYLIEVGDYATLVEWARGIPGEHEGECPVEIEGTTICEP